jgi:pimeloyl-ACP methyl ester carboxylesterase
MALETHYARRGTLHLAYQVLGSGPPDLLLLDQWFSHMEAQWDVQPLAEFRERLAAFGRLIMFDKRGSGLSDLIPTSALPTIEEWMDDVPAVLDTVGVVSGTVKDLVVGSGLMFEDRGTHELKGVPGEWRLFAVQD